ncbi:cold shock domain-containing protein [Lentilactobacillus hilgardii]|uniref:Cold shock domain-containing protein n=3 Tax=Lentilactobacillus hilgardii TaxID=1588 RepID=A0A6P1E920_LENHI|nr:cold-shock DNA-binding domain protein [Lentilactobacillus buchneri ATCC 11577]EEI71168.1 cold-shock DNA-binding domain protein [Lentilactobacillus hilgardii ATCC 27305]MCP9332883.1 cold shock domain-containing protein [Lentilactobacillus hilgardii]RRG08274.1 MAG: cold shock domain-containing protein [Lactobacillus sp.]MCP9349492.1 cold shock domain-containing protein [Lentilactobacillus hilgardii]
MRPGKCLDSLFFDLKKLQEEFKMLYGKVKTYNAKNGFGFITQDQGDNLFFFKNAFHGEDYSRIVPGIRVSYVVVEGQKGPQAAKAQIVEEAGE